MCFAAHQRRYGLRWSRELELLSLQKKLFVGDNLKKKVILVLIVFSCLRIYYKFSFNTLIIWGVKIWTLNVSVENTSRNQLLELQNFWLVCCHLECQDINFLWGWFENWKKKKMVWVPISLIDKVVCCQIKNLSSNPTTLRIN